MSTAGDTFVSTPWQRRTTLATCCSTHALQDGLTDLLYVLMPILAQAFGLNYAQIGVIRASNRTVMTVFEIPSGLLSERFGERVLVCFGLFCVGIAYIALSFASSYPAVLIALLLAGFGAAFQHTLNSSLISRTIAAGQLRTALGTYNSSGDIGKLTFAGAFTLLYSAGISWHALTFAFGILAIAAAVLVFTLLHSCAVGGRPPPKLHKTTASPAVGWGIRNRNAFAALIAMTFIDIAVQSAFLTYVAFLMIEKGLSTGLAAFAVILTLIGGVFGKFGCGFLAQRLGVIRSFILTEILTAAAIIAVLVAPTILAYLLLPLLGAVLQGTSSIIYGTVTDLVHEDRRSRGFSIIYSIANSAAIAAPVVVGIIADRAGLTTAIIAMAGAVLLTLPLCLPLRQGLGKAP